MGNLRENSEKKIHILENIHEFSEYEREKKIKWISHRINQCIKMANNKSSFYKQMYKAINIDDFEFEANWDMIPYIDSTILEKQTLESRMIAEMDEVLRYHEGICRSKTLLYSEDNWFEENITLACNLLRICAKGDIAAISLPYELAALAQSYDRAFELIGVPIISCGIQNENCSWQRLLEILTKCKISVLVCSFTRALLIANELKEAGLDVKKTLFLKKIILTGEMNNDEKRKKIHQIYGCDVISVTTIEGVGIVSASTGKEEYIFENMFYAEIVDLVTEESEQVRGELVITSLCNNVTPLIKYKTGILAQLCQKNDGVEIKYMGEIVKQQSSTQRKCWDSIADELEKAILKSDAYGLLYRIVFNNDYITVYSDIKNGYSLEELSKQIKENIPEIVHNKVKVLELNKFEREKYLELLKNSIRPSCEKIVYE